ncbi:hypothetical protein MKW98_016078 [Papaver atlanticum]|uniref:AAA+ ATPase domain-containing protein n=1 Tax=Papaver atlanticum TaxID=357466 RepID=A0AAD4XS33_9MAGN|nr:hypothetical protein MKW98_016078 [Papaver atlanticum]
MKLSGTMEDAIFGVGVGKIAGVLTNSENYCHENRLLWSVYRAKVISETSVIDVNQDPFQVIPVVKVVGMDVKFNEVLESLVPEENLVQIVGLYGTGGVGKTTLLQKVNNEFAKRKMFDVVIWIVVSNCLNFRSIQNKIGKKVGLQWSEGTETYERANDIFKGLKNRRFLLLLDDIWEGIDLETIGVSRNSIQFTGSKVVFSTRSEQVGGLMEADKRIKIECLEDDQDWSLFQQKVKQEALSCHPEVLEVAKKVSKECRGLPLALITIGRPMSSKTDLKQWQHALCTLQDAASQFSCTNCQVF